jgi:hypothetical protein
MNANDLPLEQLKTAFDTFFSQVNEANAASLEQFAQLQQRRATRFKAVETRLKASLGENDPQVVALREAAATADSLKQSLETTAIRAKRRPQITAKDWMVFGTVSNSNRDPVSGVSVRLFDRDDLLDGLLGETKTDEYGDFALVYQESDLTKWLDRIGFWQKHCQSVKKNWQAVYQNFRGNVSASGDRTKGADNTLSILPDLYLKVNDQPDKQMYVSPNPIRYTPGQSEFFEINL